MENFHFVRPLWLLALLPGAWLFWRLFRHHASGNAWQRVCDSHLLPFLLVGQEAKRRPWPLIALAAAWTLGVIALAGPAWSQLPQSLYRTQQTRVFVLDLSKSMDATDLQPNRISRARFKLLDMLKRSREGQSALVAFAGDAFTVTPLTDDTETIASLVPTLIPDLMPSQGSRLDRGLAVAGEVLAQAGALRADVIVLTDGAEDFSATQNAAATLTRKGHHVHILAVGTPQGGPIPVNGGGFLKNNEGAIVIPQVDYSALQQIASDGAGRFTPMLNDDSDLRHVLPAASRDSGSAQNTSTRQTVQWREEGPWFVLALLPLAAAAFRRGWLTMWVLAPLALTLALPPSPAQAFEWRDLFSRPDQQAARALEQGDAQTASTLFQDPNWRATAHYRAGNYDAAAKEFAASDSAESRYNYGNALAKLGRLPEALQAYDEALQRQPNHADAKQNRDLVQKLIQKQQDQKQQSNSGTQDQNSQSTPQDKQANNQRDPQQSQSENDQKREGGPKSESGQTSEGGPKSESGSDSNTDQTNESGQQSKSDPSSDGASKANDPSNNEASSSNAESSAQSSAGANGDQSSDSQSASASKRDANQQNATRKKSNAAMTDNPNPAHSSDPSNAAAVASGEADASKKASGEQAQAMEQWLRRIEDDPGGLLRRKFIRDLQQQGRQTIPGQQGW